MNIHNLFIDTKIKWLKENKNLGLEIKRCKSQPVVTYKILVLSDAFCCIPILNPTRDPKGEFNSLATR